jgi:hypothetical protein
MKNKFTGIIIVLLVVGIIFSSGCTGGETEDMLTPAKTSTTAEIEATVIELTTAMNAYQHPEDIAAIKINKISNVENQVMFNLSGIKENDEIRVEFEYSARPAKVKRVPYTPPPVEGLATPVEHNTSIANPIPVEDGYFVYELITDVSKETIVTLPGLQINSKFKAVITYDIFDKKTIVKEYELI